MSVKGNVAAFTYLQVWRAYQGRAYGDVADPENIAAGTTTHAYLVRDGITASIPQVQREIASFRGGGRLLGTMQLGVSDIGAFDVGLATYDAKLRALVNGSNVDTTSITNVTISGTNVMRADTPAIGMMLSTRFQSRSAGTDGDNLWMTVLFPAGQGDVMTPALSQDGGVNPSASMLRFTPSLTNKFPTGIALGTNQAFEDNRAEMLVLVSAHPMALTSFVADGILTQYILGYRPKYSTVTSGITNHQIAKNSVAAAPTSINTTTGVVVISAGASADVHIALYQTGFVAI